MHSHQPMVFHRKQRAVGENSSDEGPRFIAVGAGSIR
jgi:hypothetical protein